MFESILSMPRLCEKLAKGLGGWLMYEHHSHRADLFSEKYLAIGIGNILAGNYRGKVLVEFTHPILKKRKAGRPPQIDFAICDENDSIDLALESKWVGTKNSSTPKSSDILWDLVRLELLNHKFKTNALFLIAGKKGELDKLFEQGGFNDDTATGKRRPLLPRRNSGNTLDLIGCSIERLNMLTNLLKKYKRIEAPSKIKIFGFKKFPKDCKKFENQVYVWSISSDENAKRYKYSDLEERIIKRKARQVKN